MCCLHSRMTAKAVIHFRCFPFFNSGCLVRESPNQSRLAGPRLCFFRFMLQNSFVCKQQGTFGMPGGVGREHGDAYERSIFLLVQFHVNSVLPSPCYIKYEYQQRVVRDSAFSMLMPLLLPFTVERRTFHSVFCLGLFNSRKDQT